MRLLAPKDAYYSDASVQPYAGISNRDAAIMKTQFDLENELLDLYEAKADLGRWFDGIVRVCQEDDEEYFKIDADDIFMQD